MRKNWKVNKSASSKGFTNRRLKTVKFNHFSKPSIWIAFTFFNRISHLSCFNNYSNTNTFFWFQWRITVPKFVWIVRNDNLKYFANKKSFWTIRLWRQCSFSGIVMIYSHICINTYSLSYIYMSNMRDIYKHKCWIQIQQISQSRMPNLSIATYDSAKQF